MGIGDVLKNRSGLHLENHDIIGFILAIIDIFDGEFVGVTCGQVRFG